MRSNPVLQEGFQVYWIEGHAFVVYGYLLMLLAPIAFMTLFLPSLDPQGWMGPAQIFKVSSISALVLIVYFVLRIANQEFVPWRFLSRKRWLRQEGLTSAELGSAQLILLCLHAAALVLLSLPFLVWAGTIARAPVGSVLGVVLLLLFYSLSYGVWGLAAVAVWERKTEIRQVFVRGLWISLFFLSVILYLPLSPIAFVLYCLQQREMAAVALGGWRWSGVTIHWLFHLLLLGAGLLTYRWALNREE